MTPFYVGIDDLKSKIDNGESIWIPKCGPDRKLVLPCGYAKKKNGDLVLLCYQWLDPDEMNKNKHNGSSVGRRILPLDSVPVFEIENTHPPGPPCKELRGFKGMNEFKDLTIIYPVENSSE